MRIILALTIGVILTGQGCSPLAQVARTVIVEPAMYPRRLDDAVDCCRNRDLAEADWGRYLQDHTEHPNSRDFYLGFVEGFADYLYAGGTGNPPPTPPRWYWRSENETPEGRQAIQEWFSGFRVGAARARESGYRELVTLPFSTPPPGSTLPAASLARPTAPPQNPDKPPKAPASPERLPEPRKVPIESGKEETSRPE